MYIYRKKYVGMSGKSVLCDRNVFFLKLFDSLLLHILLKIWLVLKGIFFFKNILHNNFFFVCVLDWKF